jgi:phosphatidate cytidylyltransferase
MMEHDNAGDDDAGPALAFEQRLGPDFPTRVLSGLVLAGIAAVFTVLGPVVFAVLVLIVALLLSWEWGRLVHGRGAEVVIGVHIVTVGAAALLAASGYLGLGLLALPIGGILVTLLSLGRNSVYGALGVFYAGLPATAIIWLRSDADLGLIAVVFVIAVVAVADTAAFLMGRALGGPKLWPRVSPGKTWAGLIGALAASSVVGALFWLFVPGASAVRLAGVGALLGLVAQAGDLFESAIKRRFGAKDTSSLIPGHGGVMDRVDGLVAAAAAVGLAALVINVHSPAHALLLGP